MTKLNAELGNELIGNEVTSFACSECNLGTVGILQNSECIDCADIDGIACLGASSLIITYNYWVAISDDNAISSNFCPSGIIPFVYVDILIAIVALNLIYRILLSTS